MVIIVVIGIDQSSFTLYRIPQLLRSFKIGRLLKFMRMLRLFRLGSIISRWEKSMFLQHSVSVIIKYFVYIVFMGHWITCFFYWLGRLGLEKGTNNWLTESGMDTESEFNQYVAAFCKILFLQFSPNWTHLHDSDFALNFAKSQLFFMGIFPLNNFFADFRVWFLHCYLLILFTSYIAKSFVILFACLFFFSPKGSSILCFLIDRYCYVFYFLQYFFIIIFLFVDWSLSTMTTIGK